MQANRHTYIHMHLAMQSCCVGLARARLNYYHHYYYYHYYKVLLRYFYSMHKPPSPPPGGVGQDHVQQLLLTLHSFHYGVLHREKTHMASTNGCVFRPV